MTSLATNLSCLTLALLCLASAPVIGAAPLQNQGDQFLAKALDFNVCEMDLAEKAASHSSREDVQKFAQQVVDDHKKLNKELLSLASDRKIGVATGVSKEHKEVMVKMLVLKGADFDRAFLDHMTRAHENAIKLFETDGPKQADAPTRAFAERTLPIMRKHLERVKALGNGS